VDPGLTVLSQTGIRRDRVRRRACIAGAVRARIGADFTW